MKKFRKISLTLIMGFSLLTVTGCTSTSLVSEIFEPDIPQLSDIITLPSLDLDFGHNDRIELTDSLLSSWRNKTSSKPGIFDIFTRKMDLGSSVKHYLSQQIPTDTNDYFPINVEDLGTLYVISEALGAF